MRVIALALLLAGAPFASSQGFPATQPQQPGMPPPAQQPMDPTAVPAAPPGFAPAAGDASAGRVVRISGGVMAGYLVSRVDPVYPEEAKSAHISGAVVMAARIGEDGHVQSLSVVSGPQVLQTAAMDAVKQWVYKPFRLNGDPVEVATTVTVNFNLN